MTAPYKNIHMRATDSTRPWVLFSLLLCADVGRILHFVSYMYILSCVRAQQGADT